MRRAPMIGTMTTAIVALGASSVQGQSYYYPPVAPCATKTPAKLSVARASTAFGRLDVLAPISPLASGRVDVDYFSAGRHTRFTSAVNSAAGRIRFRRTLAAAQARLGTGILTIDYPGDAATGEQSVRLRAGRSRPLLELSRPRLVADTIRVEGTVNRRARGVVRLELEYQFGCDVRRLKFRGTIGNGRWRIVGRLSAQRLAQIAARTGTLYSYTAFTGYLPRRIGGQIRGYQVLGERQ
jgi:hypothetical protein